MKHKCLCSILLILTMLSTCWTYSVAEEMSDAFTSGDYEYIILDDGTVKITKYNGSAQELAIPDTLDGKKVTSIGNRVFSACRSLTSIFISDSVSQLDKLAFFGCRFLKSFAVSPDNPYFAAIDGVLFCKSNKSLISHPSSKESSTYNVPQGVLSIDDYAFFDCNFLTSVILPDSLSSIGDYAFASCSSLSSIFIPTSVTTIGECAFISCSSLSSISLPDSVVSIGSHAFQFCDSLSTISLPNSITVISDWSFSICKSLSFVSVPDSVTTIDASAFSGSSSLISIIIPDSVTEIGENAFAYCPNLTLTVPRNSYAAEYAKANNIPYTYPDANDWLNN